MSSTIAYGVVVLARPPFALSAETFLNATMDACWLALLAGRQAQLRRESRWRMNLALEQLSRCCLILPSGEKRQVQGEKPMAYVAILIGPPPT